MSSIKLDSNKTITFTPQGLSVVLDLLAQAPYRIANPLIQDIIAQVQQQNAEGDMSFGGPLVNGSGPLHGSGEGFAEA